ncbi:hypothetical protein PI125_g24698 [Phytophthora idaei]|nr:hypothetical protein PI125_g24698 [Phytophthora idaei]KAG3125510.1 hypothetical protein PI126_g22732 [Phytophthora idaei]
MQTNVMTEAARCVAASGSTSTTPSAEANSVLQRDEEPIANRRQKKSRSGNHGRGNASGRGGNEAKRRRRERDTEGECHYSHQLGHYKVDCPMRKRHRIEPEGGSADIALGDSAMREFEDQHVTTVSVAEVWGLAVLLDDSGSKTNTDDLSSCSDTLSESIGDESEARSSERVMDSMVSEDGEIGRDISRAYWHLPLQPSVAADVAAFQQAEETQAALVARTRTPVSAVTVTRLSRYDDTWIIDSGCSQHICFLRGCLSLSIPVSGQSRWRTTRLPQWRELVL